MVLTLCPPLDTHMELSIYKTLIGPSLNGPSFASRAELVGAEFYVGRSW